MLSNLRTSATNDPILGTIKHKGENITVRTETNSGRAWLHKYLHPPTNNVEGYCGYPDRNNLPSVKMEFKGVQEVALQSYSGASPAPPAGAAARYLQLFHWGASAISTGFKFTSTGEAPGAWSLNSIDYANGLYNATYDVRKNWMSDVATARRTYGSVTIYQDETAFSNRGTITIANFRPQIIKIEHSATPPLNVASRFAQVPGVTSKTKLVQSQQFVDVTDPDPSYAYDFVMMLDDIPANETEIANISAKSTTGMLRDGAFITSRLAQDVNLFEEGTLGHLYVYLRNKDLLLSLSGGLNDQWITTNFQFTWVMYSNMQPESSMPAANHICFKWFNGFELSPQSKSSLFAFQTPSAMEDELALKLANNVLYDYPDSGDASTNSLATILTAVATAAPAVISWLTNLFGKKEEKKVEKKIEKKIKPKNMPTPQPRVIYIDKAAPKVVVKKKKNIKNANKNKGMPLATYMSKVKI
nr:hypothetical protein [Hepelivirales sp.]